MSKPLLMRSSKVKTLASGKNQSELLAPKFSAQTTLPPLLEHQTPSHSRACLTRHVRGSWSSAAVLIFEAASHSGLVGGLLRSVGISGMRGSTRGSGAALAGADAAPEAVTEAAASSGAALADSDGAGGAASPGAA